MKRKNLVWAVSLGLLVIAGIGILVLKNPTLLGLKSHTGMTGGTLPQKYKVFLVENGILDEGEEVRYFYSPGMFGFETDGNILTDRRVISYWEVEGKREAWSAGFGEITGLAVHRKGGLKHDTILAVERGSGDPLVFFLSGREKWDENFIAALEAKINDPSGYPDEKQVTDGQYRDPDELAVPDQGDLKYFQATCGEAGLVILDTGFYSGVTEKMVPFAIDVSADGDYFPEYRIRVEADSFAVAREGEPGAFTEVIYSGVPEVSGDSSRITLPWEQVFGKRNDYLISCRALEGNDRLPNEGSLAFERKSCGLSWLWHPYLAWMEKGK